MLKRIEMNMTLIYLFIPLCCTPMTFHILEAPSLKSLSVT